MPNRAALLTNEKLCDIDKLIPREKHPSHNPSGLTDRKDRNLRCENCTRQRDQLNYICSKIFFTSYQSEDIKIAENAFGSYTVPFEG